MTKPSDVLFDTSSLIAFFKEEEDCRAFEELLDKVENDEINGYISVVTITELMHKIGLEDLRFAYYVVSFVEESNIKLIPLGYEAAKKAGELKLKYKHLKLSTADAQILASAIDEHIEHIATKDGAWRKVREVTVVN